MIWEEYILFFFDEKIIELDLGMVFGIGIYLIIMMCICVLEKIV